MVLLALTGAAFLYGALEVLSGGRAYIHGEGRWSKGQQEAVFLLDRYAEHGNPADLVRARQSLSVPLGDREARLALTGPAHDPERAREGFLRGGNHPADIPVMIHLLEYFEHAPWFREAIRIWERADLFILRLQEVADELERQWQRDSPSQATLDRLRNEITTIDLSLRRYEKQFSATLNEGLRVLELVVGVAGALLMLLLAGVAILVFRWATRRIRASEQRFWTSFVHAPMGLALLSRDGRFVEINEALCQILGRARARLVGQPLESVLADPDADGVPLVDRVGEEPVEFERRLTHAENGDRWCRLGLRPVPAAPDAAFIAVIEDVSEQKQHTEELSWQATHDALTGLYNRSHFSKLLAQAIQECRDGGSEHVLGFIDLDEFKTVNDTCGHVAGDELLRELAELMPQHMRAADVMARLGGDEFVFLLRDCPLEKGRMRADRLRRSVADYTFEREGRSFETSASIGVVALDGTIGDVREALDAADHACYCAKGAGRNRVWVHGEESRESRAEG